MNHLIRVTNRKVGAESVPTVSARELHSFLEVGKDFSSWIQARIAGFSFQHGIDFMRYEFAPQNGGAGNRGVRIEYAITLEMAKELSMVERNEKGKQARLYFIEMERRAKANNVHYLIPKTLPEALRLAADALEQKAALESKIEADRPKVEFHDKVCEAVNAQTVDEVAKILGSGPRRLFAWLRAQKLLKTGNLPYQEYIDRGYFRLIEKQYTDARGESHTYSQTLITGSGFAFIQVRFVVAA